jgi:hypothetical protein
MIIEYVSKHISVYHCACQCQIIITYKLYKI